MKTSSWKESDKETITYIDSSGIFGNLFAYWNDICQDEKTPADSFSPSLTRQQLLLYWYREHPWKILGSEGRDFVVSEKALGTTRSWKAQRCWETTLKPWDTRRPHYIDLSMKMLGLSRREGNRLLAINSPKDCRKKCVLRLELREDGRICSNYKCQK